MATTLGSIDLASLKNLRDDVTQYFWFESNSSSAWGSGAHVTLYPESQFTDSTNPNYMKGQNIIMNTDGFSIRNGALPMMVLDNDSLDFNAVDTIQGTYTTMATFGLTGATIGQTSGAHSIIDGNGQRFYASDGTTQLANIGYDLSQGSSSISDNPYYTFGTRKTTQTQYSSSRTYAIGDLCVYDNKIYVCKQEIETPEAFTPSHWSYYIGALSMAEGQYTTASGWLSHAEGYFTISNGSSSHSEGQGTFAKGDSSHAEGVSTQAFGAYSHSEGQSTLASGDNSHAEGYYCQATYGGSHAEGNTTNAQNWYAHSEGTYTIASGEASHAQNENTQATKKAQTVIGSYNIADNSTETTHPSGNTDYGQYALIIGNGQYVPPSPSQPPSSIYSNALTVDWGGNVVASGNVICSNIGTYRDVNGNDFTSNLTVSASESKTIASIVIPAGVWVVSAGVRFSPTSSGNHYSSICFNTTQNSDTLMDRRYGTGTNANQHNASFIVAPSSQATYYLSGTPSVAGTWNRTNTGAFWVRAVRIK